MCVLMLCVCYLFGIKGWFHLKVGRNVVLSVASLAARHGGRLVADRWTTTA